MYNDYFGFSESPFNITPNPRFYYRTQSCDEVLEVVQHGIETRKGLIVIIGEPGSGKTLFLKFLVRNLAPNTQTITVQNPHADLDEILRLLMERLELRGQVDDRTGSLERLTDHLVERRSEGRVVCLLIDEAQDLHANTLDELRLLANLEFEGDALLPLVLVGQPELNLKLDHPSSIRIKQRVALTRNIYPLIRKEVGPYIDSRLKVAGYERSDLFAPEAIDTIAAHSGGIPRMVNSICDNALFRAYTMRQSVISAHIVDQVARELRITAPFSLQKQFLRGALDSAPRGSSKLPTHQAEERSGEPFVMEQQEPNAFHRSSDTQARESADAISDLNTNKEWGAKLPAGSGTEAGTGVTPSALSARMRWVAVAGAIALLLLALNVVNSTQLAGIYSVLSGETRTTVPDSASLPLRHSQSPDNLKADSASSARATSDRMATKREPVEVATTDAGNEIKGNDVPGGANPLPAQAIEPPASALESASPQAQPADASPSKKNETRPVVTLEVVARSKVRAKPNDQSEIIAELEPGNRVTVLAKSRDYYHVRSVEDKTIRGYVHREDAFFESKNKR